MWPGGKRRAAKKLKARKTLKTARMKIGGPRKISERKIERKHSPEPREKKTKSKSKN
jgi:hypothetical protein